MKKLENWVPIIIFIVFVSIAGFSLYKFLRYGEIDGAGILFSFIIVSYFFNFLNWGNHHGGKAKDEKEKSIEAKSTKASYFILMILAGLTLFISEGVSNLSEMENYPLLIVVGLTFITLPITEYVYKRKLK